MTLQYIFRLPPTLCIFAGLILATSQLSLAQSKEKADSQSNRSEYYYPPVTKQADTPSIPQQKAMYRAKQRMARMEVNRHYGITPSRPSAVGLPFTSVSTLTWTRPRAGYFVYNSGYYRPYYYSVPYASPYVVRR